MVAHGAVLHYLIDDWYGATSGIGMCQYTCVERPSNLRVGAGWYNCEARIYCFDSSTESNIVNAAIIEIDDSRMKRTLTAHRFSGEQQSELKKGAESSWAADGYVVLSKSNAGDLFDARNEGEPEPSKAQDLCYG